MHADPSNPYAPPAADLIDANAVELKQPDAGKGLRFSNFILDYIFAATFGAACYAVIYYQSPEVDPFTALEDNRLMGVFLGFVWHCINELFDGRGLSKLITGTRAVMLDGSRLPMRSVLTRSLCRFIPFEPLSFLGRSTRGWHDTITDTRVVNVRARGIPARTGKALPGAFTPPGVKRPPVRRPAHQAPPQTFT